MRVGSLKTASFAMYRLAAFALGFVALPQSVYAQSAPPACNGLCLQQVSCPSGQTTSISGKIYAPNGKDPLPNVTVYIPNAAVDPFTAGVACPVVGAPPSGSPLVGTISDTDGSFTLTDVPVGANIPLVIVSGRWRRQLTVPGTTACADTSFDASMPKDRSEGDIPKIAIVTGALDSVECVLRKVGIQDSEFTDPSGPGRINLYSASLSPGARVSAATPNETALDVTSSSLKAYDVLMLPCQGAPYDRSSLQLAAFQDFANSGGRVYASHYSYIWMNNNPPFNTVANWQGNRYPGIPDGTADVNTTFSEGQTLAQWLQLVGASTTLGRMPISTLRSDLTTLNPPTRNWLTLDDPAYGNPVMQLTFDTPLNSANQCGRVLFNEYHVENPSIANQNVIFPNECPNSPMTPQEKLLEYSLFSLTSDGGVPSLTPESADFGKEAVGLTSATTNFTWTNNSSFTSKVTSAAVSGDFVVTGNNCGTIRSGGSCTIGVAFRPTTLGAIKGTLTIRSTGKTLYGTLTGTGLIGLVSSPSSLAFGNVPIGAYGTQYITLTNVANGVITLPGFTASGDFAVNGGCPASLPAGGSCQLAILFKPTKIGPQTGTWGVASTNVIYSGLTATLSGTGTPGITSGPAVLTFGKLDIGATATQALTLTNNAFIPLPPPPFATTGDYTATSNCGAAIPAGASCLVSIVFSPTATGTRAGTWATTSTDPVYFGIAAMMTGTGVDFSLNLSPDSDSVIAGRGVSTVVTGTPAGGFDGSLTFSCTTSTPGSSCAIPSAAVPLTATTKLGVDITTTSHYKVIGYAGLGGGRYLWIVGLAAGTLLMLRRRGGIAVRLSLMLLVLGTVCSSISGCGSKNPDANAVYTAPGDYTYTVTATDGFLVRSATYKLHVTIR